MLILHPTAGKCEDNVSRHVHILDLATHELQSLNIEQQQTVDYIADRIVG